MTCLKIQAPLSEKYYDRGTVGEMRSFFLSFLNGFFLLVPIILTFRLKIRLEIVQSSPRRRWLSRTAIGRYHGRSNNPVIAASIEIVTSAANDSFGQSTLMAGRAWGLPCALP
jgi:hypothetical protein